MDGTAGIALITGAGGGIGLACARRLGRSHRLVLTDRSAEGLERAAALCREDGHEVLSAKPLDIRSAADVAAFVADPILDGALTALVHTAGISPAMGDWRAIFEVNLVAGERLALAALDRGRPGIVAVMISSIAGTHATKTDAALNAILDDPLSDGFWDGITDQERVLGPHWGQDNFAYIFSKYAVARQVRRLAQRYAAKQGRIVAVAPGLIDTPMGRLETAPGTAGEAMKALTPLARLGAPDEIAAVVHFLTSSDAAFVTGTEWTVDGGLCSSL